MIVPIIAPTIGAGIAAVAGWRAIFIVLAVMSIVMQFWLRRLPETLAPADVRPLDFKTMVAGWATVTRHRRAAGNMIASGMLQGGLYGILKGRKQIIPECFGPRPLFPLIFAIFALGIAGSEEHTSEPQSL